MLADFFFTNIQRNTRIKHAQNTIHRIQHSAYPLFVYKRFGFTIVPKFRCRVDIDIDTRRKPAHNNQLNILTCYTTFKYYKITIPIIVHRNHHLLALNAKHTFYIPYSIQHCIYIYLFLVPISRTFLLIRFNCVSCLFVIFCLFHFNCLLLLSLCRRAQNVFQFERIRIHTHTPHTKKHTYNRCKYIRAIISNTEHRKLKQWEISVGVT